MRASFSVDVVVRIEVVDADDVGARVEQRARDVHADEAGRAGDEHCLPSNVARRHACGHVAALMGSRARAAVERAQLRVLQEARERADRDVREARRRRRGSRASARRSAGSARAATRAIAQRGAALARARAAPRPAASCSDSAWRCSARSIRADACSRSPSSRPTGPSAITCSCTGSSLQRARRRSKRRIVQSG